MAEVKLRKNFYGTLIPKVSSDSLRVKVEFDYKGPAQTLDIETNTGKRGLWGDYDQESPTYHDSKYVSKSDTFRSYTFIRYIPLSFWGTRQIDDCAVEVVIRGDGVYADAVLWDAYTVNIAPPEEYTLTLHASPSAGGTVSGAGTYPHMERVKITAYPKPGWYFDHWGGDFVSSDNPAYVYMSSDRNVTAYFYEEAVEEFTVTVRADPSYGGTVSKSPDKPKYEYGELVRLSCTPASGYYLNYWTRDGEWIESRTSFTTGVIRNHIFIALFRKS